MRYIQMNSSLPERWSTLVSPATSCPPRAWTGSQPRRWDGTSGLQEPCQLPSSSSAGREADTLRSCRARRRNHHWTLSFLIRSCGLDWQTPQKKVHSQFRTLWSFMTSLFITCLHPCLKYSLIVFYIATLFCIQECSCGRRVTRWLTTPTGTRTSPTTTSMRTASSKALRRWSGLTGTVTRGLVWHFARPSFHEILFSRF